MNEQQEVFVYRKGKDNRRTQEWNVDEYKVHLIENSDGCTVSVDHEIIKKISRKIVDNIGLEVSFKCEGNKYYLVRHKNEYRFVKDHRFIDDGRHYIS